VSHTKGTLTVTKAPLKVEAVDLNVVYGGEKNFGVAYTGFVNNETASVLGGSLSYTGSGVSALNVGSYKYAPQGLTSSNYEIEFKEGDVIIGKAPLKVEAVDLNVVYGGEKNFGVAYRGFVNNETASVLGGSL